MTVRDLLLRTAKRLAPADPGFRSIAGIVDAYAVLEAAGERPPPEVTPARPSNLTEAAVPVMGRAAAAPDSIARAKDVPPPQRALPVDQIPPVSADSGAGADSTSAPIATEEELSRKQDLLWQLKKDGLISLDQFQRQLQDLESAKHLSVNKCPAAPHMDGIVKVQFLESDRARAIALIHDYGLDAKTVDSIPSAKIKVPIGQEWFWVDTLQASGLLPSWEGRTITARNR
jgi:hypothetical protein